MATLHNNRKVAAHMPDNQKENTPVLDKKVATSRSSLLEQVFQKMTQATFDALTFQEFSKEFQADLVRGNESFLRDLHSQLVNISSSAIQVFDAKFDFGIKTFLSWPVPTFVLDPLPTLPNLNMHA